MKQRTSRRMAQPLLAVCSMRLGPGADAGFYIIAIFGECPFIAARDGVSRLSRALNGQFTVSRDSAHEIPAHQRSPVSPASPARSAAPSPAPTAPDPSATETATSRAPE